MMTHEQGLDRLERIAKLFVKAGLRTRSNIRAMDEKINILINAQIDNEESLAEKFKKLIESQMRHDQLFAEAKELSAKNDERFARFEERTERTLNMLHELLKRNGKSR